MAKLPAEILDLLYLTPVVRIYREKAFAAALIEVILQ
jgi:hypothetical protein